MLKLLLVLQGWGFIKVENKDPNYIAYQYQLKNIVNVNYVIIFQVRFRSSIIFDFDLELNRIGDDKTIYHVFRINEQINVVNFKHVKITTDIFIKMLFEKLYVEMMKQNPTYFEGFPKSVMNLFEIEMNKSEKNHIDKNMELLKLLSNPLENLSDCLKLVEQINYNSFGFPVVFLSFDYTLTQKWSVSFRNPVNFENPDTDDIDPVKSCHKMFEFLRQRLMKGNIENNLI